MYLLVAMCSVFALLSLHLFMYGCNLFLWKSSRINYYFIFEFQPSNALKYRDAFLICTSLMTAVVGALVLHLILLSTGFFPRDIDLIPGILLLVSEAMHWLLGLNVYLVWCCVVSWQCSLLLLICPLNVFYRPTLTASLGLCGISYFLRFIRYKSAVLREEVWSSLRLIDHDALSCICCRFCWWTSSWRISSLVR